MNFSLFFRLNLISFRVMNFNFVILSFRFFFFDFFTFLESETRNFRINYVHRSASMLISRIVDRPFFTMIANCDPNEKREKKKNIKTKHRDIMHTYKHMHKHSRNTYDEQPWRSTDYFSLFFLFSLVIWNFVCI